ncbi:MAG: hypothetical protein HUU54_11605 [Ignavibacteriaceae bacterium]|nr:hypothetical protein [Ignavibacteriaceae bacterium]
MSSKKKIQSASVFRYDPSFGRCPACNEYNTLRRSRSRSIIETTIKATSFYKIYRCNKCGWRGYRSTIKFTVRTAKYLASYLLLVIVVILILRQVLARLG